MPLGGGRLSQGRQRLLARVLGVRQGGVAFGEGVAHLLAHALALPARVLGGFARQPYLLEGLLPLGAGDRHTGVRLGLNRAQLGLHPRRAEIVGEHLRQGSDGRRQALLHPVVKILGAGERAFEARGGAAQFPRAFGRRLAVVLRAVLLRPAATGPPLNRRAAVLARRHSRRLAALGRILRAATARALPATPRLHRHSRTLTDF